MSNKLDEKVIRGIKVYLARNRYDVIGEDWLLGGLGIVAKDGDEIVFITCRYRYSHGEDDFEFPKEVISTNTRVKLENNMLRWSILNPSFLGTKNIRFDNIDMVIVTSDRAVLRHHINIFGSNSED